MLVGDKHYRTIWLKEPGIVQIIDQRSLPHEFLIEDITTVDEMTIAIKDMHVRGAGLIGAAAGWGMYLAAFNNDPIEIAAKKLISTRPTAVNLKWAVDRQLIAIKKASINEDKLSITLNTAQEIVDQDAQMCKKIGMNGLEIIKKIYELKNNREPVNILTHCNAGWLAFVDYGSATSPIYEAHELGIPVHVWVDETRPRNQGARLTAWELLNQGVPHSVIADNTGGHLMQHNKVDLVIVGSDRTTCTGDVCNKIGTYLKALAANDNNIPFYVALPSSTFDWNIKDGLKEIPIEERNIDEVKYIQGKNDEKIKKVLLTPQDSPAANYAFDVTPSRLVTGLITERGICKANEKDILRLFPEKSFKF